MKKSFHATAVLLAFLPCSPCLANGIGENAGWQFRTTQELANLAYIEDLRKKSSSGFYNSPQYNTYVGTQNNFNCSNSASSAGNGGTNSAAANTASSGGPSSSATGNQSAATTTGQPAGFSTVLNNGQDNWGAVGSGAYGDSLAGASGNNSNQILNTQQNNAGVQDASINGSNGCSFAGPTGGSN